MPRGFQWFVAWRYLMARPRRLSPGILVFTASAVWVALAEVGAILGYPLAYPYLPGPSVPLPLVLAVSAGLALVPVALIAGLAHALTFVRSRRLSPSWVRLAGFGVLVAVAALGVAALVRRAGGLDASLAALPIPPALALVPAVLAAGALGAFIVLGLLDVFGVVKATGLRALATISWAFAILLLLPLAAIGVRAEIVPILVETPAARPAWLVAGAAAFAALALACVGAALRRAIRRRPGAREPLVLAALAALVVVALAVAGVWLAQSQQAWSDARDFGLRQAPMWMSIPATIAGALAGLSLVLAAIRYVFTFFTTVSIGGVCIGAMALVIVLSVMSGFETDLREKILGSNAHMEVTKEQGRFTEYREVADEIARVPGVVAQTPYLTSEVVIAANQSYANVIIKGIDPRTIGDVTDLDEDTNDPRAVGKLWPLADDGGVAGPPVDAGPAPGSGDESGDRGKGGAAREVTDPAPPDMEVDIGTPMDFSGTGDGTAPAERSSSRGVSGDGNGQRGGEGADMGAGDGDGEVVDRAPPDMEVDIGTPMDFSGTDDGRIADPALPPGEPPPGAPPETPTDLWGEPGRGDPLGMPLGELDEDPGIPPGVARLPGVLVGRELVKQVSMYVGEEVKVVSPLGQDTPLGPVPRTKRFRVAGVFYTGMYEYDLKYIYVTLQSLQDFLDLGDEVNGIEIRVEDPERTEPVEAALEARLGAGYLVKDWKQINKSLFSALKLEKIAMFLVLAIIILVASFSIIGNLVMVVVEKAKEIALLKTLGASDGGVMKVFVVQGFFIGLVGTIVGVCLGLIVCWLGMTYGLPLDPDVYYIDQLPIHVEATSVVAVGIAGILISVVATLYPAYIAARVRPVEGLRYE